MATILILLILFGSPLLALPLLFDPRLTADSIHQGLRANRNSKILDLILEVIVKEIQLIYLIERLSAFTFAWLLLEI